jgi:hypothetical protein
MVGIGTTSGDLMGTVIFAEWLWTCRTAVRFGLYRATNSVVQISKSERRTGHQVQKGHSISLAILQNVFHRESAARGLIDVIVIDVIDHACMETNRSADTHTLAPRPTPAAGDALGPGAPS